MTNVFEQMKAKENLPTETPSQEPVSTSGEIDYNALSNKPVGETYVRQDLNGKTVTVVKASLFPAQTRKPDGTPIEPVKALKDPSKLYHKCNFIIYYDTENQDREYLSGVIQFVQRDGSLAAPSFWYPDADNQVSDLWESVAKAKNVKPEDLSPREFLAFLNNKPRALIEKRPFKNITTGGTVQKNMVKEFIIG